MNLTMSPCSSIPAAAPPGITACTVPPCLSSMFSRFIEDRLSPHPPPKAACCKYCRMLYFILAKLSFLSLEESHPGTLEVHWVHFGRKCCLLASYCQRLGCTNTASESQRKGMGLSLLSHPHSSAVCLATLATDSACGHGCAGNCGRQPCRRGGQDSGEHSQG